MFLRSMGAGKFWAGRHGPDGWLCRIPLGLGRLGPIGV